jgi:hypothetical protein
LPEKNVRLRFTGPDSRPPYWLRISRSRGEICCPVTGSFPRALLKKLFAVSTVFRCS